MSIVDVCTRIHFLGTKKTSHLCNPRSTHHNQPYDANKPMEPGKEPQSAPPAKRKRASKPKVRTGCLTCKIRRVKCDEAKPSCTRCTSTGRTCDGYGAPRQRQRRSSSSSSYLSTFFTSTPLAAGTPRSLTADIAGTPWERRCFHQFRALAATGLTLHAASAGAAFWAQTVPRAGHASAAVRHAAIAVGGAWEALRVRKHRHHHHHYHQHHHEEDGGDGGDDRNGDYAARLEAFTLRQYNRAIAGLRAHGDGDGDGGVEVTLLCCLLFVCLETARGDSAAALTHIASGLQIVAGTGIHPDSGRVSFRLERAEWRRLLDVFLELELATAPHWASPQSLSPRVAMGAHAVGRLVDGALPAWGGDDYSSSSSSSGSCVAMTDEVASAAAAHRMQLEWSAHSLRRIWETLARKGDAFFWAQAAQRRQQQVLVSRGRRVLRLLDGFSEREAARELLSRRERCSILIDMMHTRVMLVVVQSMPYAWGRAELAGRFLGEARAVIELGERVVRLLGRPDEVPDLMMDNGILAVMRCVIYGTVDPELRVRGLGIMRFLDRKHETIYHGHVLVRLFGEYDVNGSDRPGAFPCGPVGSD
ncbi:hypothetical protein F4779DRAFT_417657 [Xylariaceae sp. FL0662B]|nr:hypothetical protein F4779DRAFT_417657 [Xylariaceae sp. FL0662B]